VNTEESFDNSTYAEEMHVEESELSTFINAVKQMLGSEQARLAAEDWLDEAELMDSPPRSTRRDWRAVTIAASARLADRLNVERQGRAPLFASTDTNVSPIPTSNCAASVLLAWFGGKEMSTNSQTHLVALENPRPASAEQRLQELGITLPTPPQPFGTYAEAVHTGNLLFLTGMLPTEGREPKFIGRVGAELDMEAGRKAAHLTALNALAVAREHLGSLDRVTRVVRLGVSVATSGDGRDLPKIADAASQLLQDVFGKEKNPCRLVYGVASLPLGTPVELEVIFEVGA
jgi:enamine deaminase RidA (YjgF/YER057c/UK114 family)